VGEEENGAKVRLKALLLGVVDLSDAVLGANVLVLHRGVLATLGEGEAEVVEKLSLDLAELIKATY